MSGLGWLMFVQGDLEAAETWWEQSSGANDTVGTYLLGYFKIDIGDEEEGELLLLQAASKGVEQAMVALGDTASRRSEPQEAESWFLKAADVGDAGAMLKLGVLLLNRGD
jgi:TPR repeat protein